MTLQGATETASRVVASLSATPTLLVIVILNITMMGVAGWFLDSQETNRAKITAELVKLITVCLDVDKQKKQEPP